MPESMGYCHGYLTENRSVAAQRAHRTSRSGRPATTPSCATIAAGGRRATTPPSPAGIARDRFGAHAGRDHGPLRQHAHPHRHQPRTPARSVLLPGYGHLVAGRRRRRRADAGQPGLQRQRQPLRAGRPDLHAVRLRAASCSSDLRYARMPGRPFTESTMAHNTVTVNRRDQYRSNQPGPRQPRPPVHRRQSAALRAQPGRRLGGRGGRRPRLPGRGRRATSGCWC